MALLPILEYPDSRLRTVAKPVSQVDDTIRTLIDDMFETMYAAPGIGLAATQVDQHIRVIVMDVAEEGNEPLVFINPEIIEQSGEMEYQEGCLSLPESFELVKRYANVTVKALDRDGNEFTLQADDLLSVCIQHEIDHLDGKLFVDHLSTMKRDRVRKQLEKRRRVAQRQKAKQR